MKVSDLKGVSLNGNKVWAQTIDHADSKTLIKSDEFLHKWADDFISQWGDAGVNLESNGTISITKETNEKFDKWFGNYIKAKGEFVSKYGSN